jgi:hypothetical protein
MSEPEILFDAAATVGLHHACNWPKALNALTTA